MTASNLVQPLKIPPFHCPFPMAVHPSLDVIDRKSIDWLRSFGLFRGDEGIEILRGWHHPELAARAHPNENQERVQFMADLVHWTIVDDAMVDRDSSRVSVEPVAEAGGFPALAGKIVRMLEVPDAQLLPESPWISSLMDLRHRLETMATPRQIRRWIVAFREYLLAAAWSRSCRSTPTLPSLTDYVTWRTPDGGMQIYTSLADVVGEYDLSDTVLADPQIRALTEMAHTVIAWDNDLFSHYKETLTEDPCINLITVIAVEWNCSPSEAVVAAMSMRDRALRRYRVVRAYADERKLDGDLHRYLANLDRWIAANIDMSANSTRYLNPLHRPASDGPRASFIVTRTETINDDTSRPLPFPSIAWWWQDELASRM